MISNTKYKDSVFRLLFNSKKEALGLYNNLYNTNYTDENLVELVTLEDVLFMPRKNDLAFLMNGKFLVLLEHQSTINENMPLRLLLYVARLYEKILDLRNIYKKNLIPIPLPEFIVLYNGTENLKKDGKKVTELELKLSDAFEEVSEDIPLELKVKVVDIRYSSKHESVTKGDTLEEYSEFMQLIADYRKQEKNLDEVMKKAIEEAIGQGILAEFLKKHGSEVYNMLTLEYNEEVAREVEREEALEEGRIKGIVEAFRSMNITDIAILQQLQQQFGLTEAKAKEYMSMF